MSDYYKQYPSVDKHQPSGLGSNPETNSNTIEGASHDPYRDSGTSALCEVFLRSSDADRGVFRPQERIFKPGVDGSGNAGEVHLGSDTSGTASLSNRSSVNSLSALLEASFPTVTPKRRFIPLDHTEAILSASGICPTLYGEIRALECLEESDYSLSQAKRMRPDLSLIDWHRTVQSLKESGQEVTL
jgi:hypothetical protein